jgi:hypothetical protein
MQVERMKSRLQPKAGTFLKADFINKFCNISRRLSVFSFHLYAGNKGDYSFTDVTNATYKI